MNKLMRYIKLKRREKEYCKYIEEHRENVQEAFIELAMNPDLTGMMTEDFCAKLKERIDVHDASKYSAEEFDGYRAYYYPIDEEEAAGAKEEFEKAWEHHWKNNDHHWEYRQNDDDKTMTEEQYLAVAEMVCDWLAMGYKFNNRPYQYYNKHKDKMKIPEIQKVVIENFVYGLEKTKVDRTQYGRV